MARNNTKKRKLTLAPFQVKSTKIVHQIFYILYVNNSITQSLFSVTNYVIDLLAF